MLLFIKAADVLQCKREQYFYLNSSFLNSLPAMIADCITRQQKMTLTVALLCLQSHVMAQQHSRAGEEEEQNVHCEM